MSSEATLSAKATRISRDHGAETGRRIHWMRTLAAKGNGRLRRDHLRFRPKPHAARALHCLLVDCSHSMLAGQRLASAKGLLLQLIQMSYVQRSEVALVGFSGSSAKIHLEPTRAKPLTSRLVEHWLHPVRGGGATPLAAGVAAASHVLTRAAFNNPQQHRWLWLLTDGRTLESPERPLHVDHVVIIDCDQRRVQLSGCRALAHRWRAQYRSLLEFTPPPARDMRS